MTTASDTRLDIATARRLVERLRRLEREVEELRQIRRTDALDAVREAVRRVGEIGSPEGILDRAAEELGASSAFRRVLIGRLHDGTLQPHAIWTADGDGDATLARVEPVRLAYPLVEHEVAQRQGAAIVDVAADGARAPRALADALGWRTYVVAALTLHGTTIGLLHADADRPVDALDLEVATIYADGLAGAFERAALRKTLQRHRDELDMAVRWMSRRLEDVASETNGDPRPDEDAAAEAASFDALTAREREVLQLLARGRTNRAIAETLVISEGTAKYHVKNVLRKLQATSRADAVARYLRALRRGER